VSEEKKEKAPKAEKPEGAAKAEKTGGKKEGKGKKAASGDLQIAAPGETKISPSATPRLQKIYRDQVIPKLQKEFNYSNAMQVPRLKKVVINCAVKEAVGNPKVLDNVLSEISAITGQKAVMTRARKAIATFKIRKGLAIGVRVTLRRARMYEFLDRFMNVALPRVRDFKGVNPKSFDGRGNYSVGVREQIIFPEINYDKVDKIRGMTISIETTAQTNEHARALLAELGMPFRK
jgi:large subunit ribosomal protein L5